MGCRIVAVIVGIEYLTKNDATMTTCNTLVQNPKLAIKKFAPQIPRQWTRVPNSGRWHCWLRVSSHRGGLDFTTSYPSVPERITVVPSYVLVSYNYSVLFPVHDCCAQIMGVPIRSRWQPSSSRPFALDESQLTLCLLAAGRCAVRPESTRLASTNHLAHRQPY